MFESNQLLLQLLLLVACWTFSRLSNQNALKARSAPVHWQQPKTIALTDDRTTAGLGGCRASCGGRRRGVGLGNQSKGRLVVVVVHNAQVHGKDCCGCGWHLHGQRCRAHVN